MEGMLRASVGWSWAFGVLTAVSVVRAQEDGPGPVNSTVSVSAGADEDIRLQPRRGEARDDQQLEHPLGTYAGVAPGASIAPPVQATRTESKPLITWPGFQMRPDGTSRVFIQSTAALTPQPSAAAAKFSVHLAGAKVAGNTNRLPLETRFFNTPVSRVNIDVQRDGVTLVLDMRADVSPVVSSERGPTGYYFLYIDFPKGQYVQAPPPTAEAPPSPTDSPKHLDTTPKPTAQSQASVHTKAEASATQNQVKASGKAEAKGSIKLGL
jgi:hypothetical protein